MIGTVVVYRTYYRDSEVVDGDLPRDENGELDTVADAFPVDTVTEAVDVIQSEGLTFAATGNDWAAHPDGSYPVTFATDERVEVTAHLRNFTENDAAAIMDAVG
jgi:hypothetical protein